MTDSAVRARFADFEFDAESGELRRGATVTRLQRQPARVLELLLRDAGAVVTREALKAAVWPDTVVEFDQGLNYCIRQIRSALDDTADAPRFIETLARRGYRFIESVVWDAPAAVAAPASAARGLSLSAGVALVLIVAAVTGWFVIKRPREVPSVSAAATAESLRVAVLPLRELANETSLTERLVVELAAAQPSLDVLGPATTGVMRGDERSQLAMGKELRVAYIISGGIRTVDSGLFIQAVRVRDGTHVFARILARDVISDAMQQDSAMQRLADSLAVRLHDDLVHPAAPRSRSGTSP